MPIVSSGGVEDITNMAKKMFHVSGPSNTLWLSRNQNLEVINISSFVYDLDELNISVHENNS